MLRDEAREALEKSERERQVFQIELPETLESLSKPEANRWVRYVVPRVDIDDDFGVALRVTMNNAMVLYLG